GRIAQAFSRRAWIFGALLMFALFLVTRAPQLVVISMLALPRLFGRAAPDEREALPKAAQRNWALAYFGLAAFLPAGVYVSSSSRHPPALEDDSTDDATVVGPA